MLERITADIRNKLGSISAVITLTRSKYAETNPKETIDLVKTTADTAKDSLEYICGLLYVIDHIKEHDMDDVYKCEQYLTDNGWIKSGIMWHESDDKVGMYYMFMDALIKQVNKK